MKRCGRPHTWLTPTPAWCLLFLPSTRRPQTTFRKTQSKMGQGISKQDEKPEYTLELNLTCPVPMGACGRVMNLYRY